MESIVVIFGGQSSEHDVSCMSVMTVLNNLDSSKYDVTIIGITKEGEWLFVPRKDQIEDGKWTKNKNHAYICPDAVKHCVIVEGASGFVEITVDVIFPVLHGKYGEDGTIQGLLELSHIPYVGCGVFSSSAAMDKISTKMLMESVGIKQGKYTYLEKDDLENEAEVISQIENALEYPCFVKPSRAGSSIGVSRVENRDELLNALYLAGEHDSRILIEEFIEGREIECAILGGKNVEASGVGEVVAANHFYDYEAKYHNEESKTVVSPDLPYAVESEIQETAIKIFKTLDGYGLSRVDFFVRGDEVIFNEINTMPGFTPISMYPMLWNEKGIAPKELIEKLIALAKERYIS